MKINWGTSIVLVFIGFISFILYFVVKMNSNKNLEHDLVTKEYYKEELAFQNEIDAENNSKSLKQDITLDKNEEGLVITFPNDKDYQKISGTVSLYRPSNKRLDFEIPIMLSNSTLIIRDDVLLEGRWNISIHWQYDITKYLFKKSITY